MDKYGGAGRTLCTDNFYTSVKLAEKLLQQQTHLVGTLRSNRRGLPKSITTAQLKKGDVVAVENNAGITVLKWKDKRDVLMLSTMHNADVTEICRKRKDQKVIKPVAVLYYNEAKQGIDVSEQMISYHRCLRKTIRWFHKVAIDVLLGTAVVNACNLLNMRRQAANTRKLQITDFREQLCEQLIQPSQSSEVSRRNVPRGYYLCQSTVKQSGKRTDRRLRKYWPRNC